MKSLAGKIKDRLHSEDGASLSVALLFFVMCAVVGSVILAAAGSTAGRISRIKEADNNRFALESAAKLLEKTLVNEGSVICSGDASAPDDNTFKLIDDSGTEISNPSSFVAMKKDMAQQMITANWDKIVACDPTSEPVADGMKKVISYRLDWKTYQISALTEEKKSSITQENQSEYASATVFSDRDKTNVILLVPNEKAVRQPITNTSKDFEIQLDQPNYPEVYVNTSMDQYGRIEMMLTLKPQKDSKSIDSGTGDGESSESQNSNRKSNSGGLKLIVDANPAIVQFDRVLDNNDDQKNKK